MIRNILITITLILLLGVCAPVSAVDYAVLEPLPGTGGSETPSLESYLPAVFDLAIGIGAGMAFVMITLGGIIYATSDSLTGKSQGKEYIENAIWGLLLVIGAWTILYTINPQMLEFTLSIKNPPPIEGKDPVGVGVKMSDEDVKAHENVLTRLAGGCGVGNKCVEVNNNGTPCKNGEVYGCTNLNGLPESTIITLIALKMDKNCNCDVMITGGTEEGAHKTHGPGKSIVDLRPNPNLDKFIRTTGKLQDGTKNTYVKRMNGGTAVFTFEPAGGRSTGDHWHVIFK